MAQGKSIKALVEAAIEAAKLAMPYGVAYSVDALVLEVENQAKKLGINKSALGSQLMRKATEDNLSQSGRGAYPGTGRQLDMFAMNRIGQMMGRILKLDGGQVIRLGDAKVADHITKAQEVLKNATKVLDGVSRMQEWQQTPEYQEMMRTGCTTKEAFEHLGTASWLPQKKKKS